MNVLTAEIPFSKISKIELYMNYSKKSMEEVKKATGCDYICNGGLFNGLKPVCNLKVNGTIQARDEYTVHGYAWDNSPSLHDFHMITIPTDWSSYENAISCTEAIYNKEPCIPMYYDSDINGRRGRTAIGMKGYSLMLFCSLDGSTSAYTPEGLRDYLFAAGWDSAILLDGGTSSQCDFMGDVIIPPNVKKVNNLVLIYLQPKNPYPVPTRALTQGCKGNDVKWLQFQLKKVIKNATIAVDGSFGPKTYELVIAFQSFMHLTIDGSVGPATRKALLSFD